MRYITVNATADGIYCPHLEENQNCPILYLVISTVVSFIVTGFLFSIFGNFTIKFASPTVVDTKSNQYGEKPTEASVPLQHVASSYKNEQNYKEVEKAKYGKIIFLIVMWVIHILFYSALTTIILLKLSPWEENTLLIGFLLSEFGFMFILCLVVWCIVKCQVNDTSIQSSNQGLLKRQALDFQLVTITPLDLPITNNLQSLGDCTEEVKKTGVTSWNGRTPPNHHQVCEFC
jgi:hypothetical protein